jgi:DNA-binding NtrC family response regulator
MAPVRILIVEDERIIGFDLRRRLARMGYTMVAVTASGEEAIAYAHQLRPDLVLIDVQLHGPMDGVEAAQQIWTQAEIPVVFMSGYTTVETLARVWRTVPADYLSKPFFDDQLRAALERTLETRRQRQSGQRPHSQC